MKHVLCYFSLLVISAAAYSQGTRIGDSPGPPEGSAGLDVDFQDKGFLPPRMTEEERNAISNPASGLVIYNTTTGCLNFRMGSSWKQVCGECDFTTPGISSNSPLCEGETINVNAGALNDAVYAWSGPGGFEASTQGFSISDATPVMSGTYTVSVTKNGCTAQNTVEITVNPIPDAPAAGSNSPICVGGNLELTAGTVSGASYSWSGPGGFVSSSQNPVINGILSNGEGIYSVQAVVNGCTSSVASTSVVLNGSSGNSVFSYSGDLQSFEVPECVFSIQVKMWGAGGGGGANSNQVHPFSWPGGGGGFVSGTVAVTPGETLSVLVGGAGALLTGGYGGGGSANAGSGWQGGGGGGRSAIRRDTEELITAGGGGGGGGGSIGSKVGGGGGGRTGQNGEGTGSGGGGQLSAGGYAGSSGGATAGAQFIGGNGGSSQNSGGGGGGGYWGGGGGSSGGDSDACGAGGGGSGFYGGTGVTNGVALSATGQSPGNLDDIDRNGAGNGGAVNSSGTNGRVIISW